MRKIKSSALYNPFGMCGAFSGIRKIKMRSGKPFSAGKSSFKGKNPKDSSTFRGYGKNEDRNVFQKPNHEEQDGKDEKLGFPRYSDVEIL